MTTGWLKLERAWRTTQ